jgi:L-fuconolactonase
MTVDSHTHVSMRWFEPVEVLLFQLDRHGIEQAVLVQFSGEYDNGYQSECARRYPDRLVSVVSVDAADPDAVSRLTDLAGEGATGVRLRPTARSAGDDPLAVWRAAESLGLAVSCLGRSADFAGPEFAALLGEVPRLRVVLEHLGELRRENAALTVAQVERVCAAMAPFPNVSVKVHGFGEGAARAADISRSVFADPEPAAKVLRAYDVLGPERLMWGSDFPPSSGREGYTGAYRHPLEALRAHGMTAAGEASIFGDLARRVFRLPTPA